MAAMVAIGCAVVIGLTNVAWTVAFKESWTGLFTKDAAVESLAAAAMPLMGLCELGNCPQTTGCGVLRGTARPAVGARINLLSFYLVGMPVALGFAFVRRVGFGGLWYGLLTAQLVCVVSVILVVLGWTDWDAEATRARKLTAVEFAAAPASAVVGEEAKRFLGQGEA